MISVCHVLIGLHSLCRYVGLLRLLFSFFLTPKPLYNTIWQPFEQLFHVRYDLATFSMYNINLRAAHTTILSIRGVTIPIDLVSSATNSIRQHVVLFKSVTVPTSDPKSEFLCQSCYDRTSLIRRYIGLHHFFSHSPTPKPMYDTISQLSHVRYDLPAFSCTIRSLSFLLYDTISWFFSVRYQSRSHHYYNT